ncbi:MAG: HNH endonuclease [Firmicutes bacterium]|nr:HNH endonuclease [Bacillota bacterium]
MNEKQIYDSFAVTDLSSGVGRFLSDKSYAYDAVYFMSKFIKKNLDSNNCFDKNALRTEFISYTADIFQLEHDSSVIPNYMSEVINVLCFARVLVHTPNGCYKVQNLELLDYILLRIENAYIFLYLLVHRTFLNHNLLDDYKKILSGQKAAKEIALNSLFTKFIGVSISVGARGTGTNWAKMLVKYPLTVLGFANNGLFITRTLQISDRTVNVEDISINVEGTRTPSYLPKKNEYVSKFDKNYVLNLIKDYLFVKVNVQTQVVQNDKNIADSLADLKIDILQSNRVQAPVSLGKYEQEQFVNTQIRGRNTNIQRTFRDSLFKNYAHKCAICDFSFPDFLIASHIVPYSQCEDTYDAINHYNGLLLCPLHDRLFEGGKFMTVLYDTGEIILANEIKTHKDFTHLIGKKIDKSLYLSERKHYLKTHNDLFNQKNK